MESADNARTHSLIQAHLDMFAYPMFAFDKHGFITHLNRPFTELFGWELSDLRGKNMTEFVPNGRADELKSAFAKLIDGKSPIFESQRLHKDGYLIDVEISLGAFPTWPGAASPNGGRPRSWFQMLRDLTPAKDLELELMRYRAEFEQMVQTRTLKISRSEERLNQLINRSPQAIIEWDHNFRVSRWNKAAEEIFGFTEEEALGQHATFNLEKSVWPHVDQIWHHLMTLEGGEHSVNRNVCKDGRVILCEWFNQTLTDKEGQPTGVLSFVSDITDKKKVENQLQYQASLLEYTSDAIVALDNDLLIQSWNRAAEEMYGYRAEEVIGRPLSDVLTTEYFDYDSADVRRLVLAQGSLQGRAIQKTASGRELMIDASLATINDTKGRAAGFVAINRDVTLAHKAQEQINYQANLLEFTTDAIVASDQNFILRSWNHGAENLYGYKAEEVIGRPVADILTTHYFNFSPEEALEKLEKAGALKGRALQTTARGEKFVIDASLAVISDNEGNKIGYVGVNRDVTKEYEGEEERQRLITILENTTDLVGTASLDGQVTYLNRAGRKILGLPLTGDLEFNTLDGFSEDYKEIGAQAIQTAAEEGTWSGELMLVSRDKEYTPVSMVILSHRDESGETAFFSTVARDISRQKYQERQNFLRMKMSQQLSDAKSMEEVFAAVADYGNLYPDLIITILEKQLEPEVEGQPHRIMMVNHTDTQKPTLVGRQIVYDRVITDPLDDGQVFISANLAKENAIGKQMKEFAAQNAMGSVAMFPLMVDENNRYGALSVTSPTTGFFNQEMIGQYQSLAEEITLALRSIYLNREIEASLDRRSREVAITTQIAQEIATADNLLEIYEQVVKQVQESFGFYHTQILQYNPAIDAVHLIVGYGETGQKMLEQGHQMPMGVGLIGVAAESGRSVLRPDVRVDPSWQPNPLLPETRGELAVPIKFQDRVLGVLDIQTEQANVLSEADQVMLEGLCGVIAVAIESTHLRQDMAYRLDELDALQRSLSREGWRSLQQLHSGGYLFDQSVVRPLTNENSDQGTAEEEGLAELMTTQTSTLVSQPLAVRGEKIGMIALQDLPDQPLTPEEQQLLSEISGQVAEALENARLFEQTQRRAAELETVAELSTTTATILEQEKLLKSVADLTKEGFGLEHVNIYLFDPRQQALVLAAGSGQVGELLTAENLVLPLTEQDATAVKVFQSNTPIIRNTLPEMPHPFLKKVKSLLCAPLAAGGELLGVIGLMAAQTNVFQKSDLPIFTTLANQVATSLQTTTLYQEQKETAEKLIEVDRLKSEFLASMSHELRTPLNSIIGFADVLLEGIDGELNDRMTEDVLLIRDGGRHLRNLIGEILDMSKIEAGMMQLNYGPVDLKRVTKEVVATTSGLITNKPIKLVQHIAEDVDIIEADRTRLIQILLNLLSNAAKFTDEGIISLEMEKDTEKNQLLIKVQDSGVGIKEEDSALVFEQFRQVGGMENRKAGGTGLGMPITKNLIELHGGDIWLESVYGVGTTFYFTIPYERPVKNSESGQRYYT